VLTAGVDAGTRTTKAVILKGDQVVGRGLARTGFVPEDAARQALEEALRGAGLAWGDLGPIVATGAGRKALSFIHGDVTEVRANARGAICLHPAARTIIDVGAEEARAIRCNPAGRVLDFTLNDKCAAGAGAFVESMAHALQVSLEEMGPLSLQSQNPVPMNAQCVIFAESEVISLIHARTPRADIARSIHQAIASRTVAMLRRVGAQPDVVLVGGLAQNVGFVDSLQRELGLEVVVPEYPEFVGAVGAAWVARDQV